MFKNLQSSSIFQKQQLRYKSKFLSIKWYNGHSQAAKNLDITTG